MKNLVFIGLPLLMMSTLAQGLTVHSIGGDADVPAVIATESCDGEYGTGGNCVYVRPTRDYPGYGAIDAGRYPVTSLDECVALGIRGCRVIASNYIGQNSQFSAPNEYYPDQQSVRSNDGHLKTITVIQCLSPDKNVSIIGESFRDARFFDRNSLYAKIADPETHKDIEIDLSVLGGSIEDYFDISYKNIFTTAFIKSVGSRVLVKKLDGSFNYLDRSFAFESVIYFSLRNQFDNKTPVVALNSPAGQIILKTFFTYDKKDGKIGNLVGKKLVLFVDTKQQKIVSGFLSEEKYYPRNEAVLTNGQSLIQDSSLSLTCLVKNPVY